MECRRLGRGAEHGVCMRLCVYARACTKRARTHAELDLLSADMARTFNRIYVTMGNSFSGGTDRWIAV